MKIVVLFLFIAPACLAFEISLNMKTFADQCAKENKIDLTVFLPGKKPDPAFLKSKPYKCFMHCVSTKSGIMNASGDIVPDKLKSVLNASNDVVEKATQCAKSNKQSDKCERSAAIKDCIRKKVPGLFPDF